MPRLLALLAMVALLAAPARAAADDDDLAPLGPVKPKAKAPAKPKPAPAKKPGPAPVARPAPRPAADDDLAPLTPVAARGELSVRLPGGPPGAVLLVDGKEQGPFPAARLAVAPGEHQVLVRRPGYFPFSRKVTVTANRTTELEVRLVPGAAVLTVRTDITDAQVTLNGRVVGVTPLVDLEVPPGSVELVVSREGYQEERQRLVVAAGRDYPVSLRLTPLAPGPDAPVERTLTPGPQAPGPLAVSEVSEAPPLTQRWYFWVGVGAAVAVVAAGTAMGVTAAMPPRKQTPGEICGPQGCDACLGQPCLMRAAPLVSW